MVLGVAGSRPVFHPDPEVKTSGFFVMSYFVSILESEAMKLERKKKNLKSRERKIKF